MQQAPYYVNLGNNFPSRRFINMTENQTKKELPYGSSFLYPFTIFTFLPSPAPFISFL